MLVYFRVEEKYIKKKQYIVEEPLDFSKDFFNGNGYYKTLK